MSNEMQQETAQQEDLQEEYLRSLDELEVGQLIESTVVAVTNEQVFVDVGYKSEGKINLTQFDSPPSEGDRVQVVLINKEGRNGEVVVSKQKADEKIIWKRIKTAYQDNIPIEGVVSRAIKGGFEVSLGADNHGFNPISKIDLFKIDNPEKYIGVKSNFYIERLYNDHRVNIVLSRRKWLEKEMNSKRQKFFEEVDENDVVEGVVKSFTSFGAFVDLGGFDGLLHVNDMSWGHVAKPKDYVKKGDSLKFKVIRLDPAHKKINLSLKDLTENPWGNFTDRFQLHDTVAGTVRKLTDFGAFVELEAGIEGLVHISEFSWTKHVQHPKDMVNIGDELEVKILGFDLDAHKISLGIKQTLPNPWNGIKKTYPDGKKVKGIVRKITSTGAFVELEEGISGFLHAEDLSWTKRHNKLSTMFEVDDEIDVVILNTDIERHNIRVGIKQLEDNPWEKLTGSYSVGSLIEAEVTRLTGSGVVARIMGGLEGLIPKRHLASKELDPDAEMAKYKEGQKVLVSILEVDPPKQKLFFSIRDVERSKELQEIEKYITNSPNEESSATLADFVNRDSSKQ